MLRRSLITFVLCLGAAGCAGDPSEANFDPDARTSAVVTTRMGLGWANLNHRITLWRVRLAPEPGAAGTESSLDAAYIGGDFSTGETMSDTPMVEMAGLRASATDPSQMGFARERIILDVDPSAESQTTVSLARSSLRLAGYPRVVALLQGLELNTDVPQDASYPPNYDPAHGYTSRGFGAGVEVTALDDDTLSLAVRARFEHGHSDRTDMNAAMEVARTRVAVDVLLVGLPANAPLLEGRVDYRLTYPEPEPLVDQDIPAPSAEQTAIDLQAPPGSPSGIYGLASFDFRLDPDEPGAGYYIREMDVGVALRHHDVPSGAATFDLVGYASNATGFLAFYALRTQFEGELVWLPVPVTTESIVLSEAFETGAASFDLP